jgi:glycosyltransferase involved in cell wall biosynthesis
LRVAVNLEQLLSPSPGGVGRYAAKLVANLVLMGTEIQPFVARHSKQKVAAAWAEFGLQSVPEPRRLPLPRPLLYDSWHLLAWPPLSSWPEVDLVHAPSLAVPPKSGKPLVVSVHDAAPWLFPEAFGRRGRWFHTMGARAAGRRADRVVTGTRAAADEIVRHMRLPQDCVRVVPYGVDLAGAQDVGANGTDEVLGRFRLGGTPYVLWVGSMEPRKGVGTLVAAMARLAGRGAPGVPAQLVLAGYAGWQNSTLIASDDRARLGPALRQLGRVSEAELRALYAGATVFGFPSLHEGFGLPVLEAMAVGTPVVASDIPALREVAGDAAVLVAAGDVSAWAEALEALLAGGPHRDWLVEAGRRRARLFPWSATAAATIDVYKEVTA